MRSASVDASRTLVRTLTNVRRPVGFGFAAFGGFEGLRGTDRSLQASFKCDVDPRTSHGAASHDLCSANPPCSQSMLFMKLIVRCASAGKVTSSAKRQFSLTDGHCLGVFLVTSVGLVSLTVHKELKTGTRGNL